MTATETIALVVEAAAGDSFRINVLSDELINDLSLSHYENSMTQIDQLFVFR